MIKYQSGDVLLVNDSNGGKTLMLVIEGIRTHYVYMWLNKYVAKEKSDICGIAVGSVEQQEIIKVICNVNEMFAKWEKDVLRSEGLLS